MSLFKKYYIFILLFINTNVTLAKQYDYINNNIEYNKIYKYKKNVNEKLIINNFNLKKLHKLLTIIDIFIKKYSKIYDINKLIYLKGLIYVKLYQGRLFSLNKYNYQNILHAFKIFNTLKNNSKFKNNKLLNYYFLYTRKIILKKKISIIKYYFYRHNYIAVINRSNEIINYIDDKKIIKMIEPIIKYSYLQLNIRNY
ncbi:MAG: outer membrane protein assembly factor BamD [Candidatus Lightella neohaematopini]|nr:outer membrane protein assembly factor BamD [Candidatus Lightella neohaematopini]MCV2528648.1 outer membrane protein assembly factor BamD [Candidatus Lightella neohaematopini]